MYFLPSKKCRYGLGHKFLFFSDNNCYPLNKPSINEAKNFSIETIYNNKSFFSVTLSKDNHQRLTVAPGLWVAFKGLSVENIALNLSNIEHDPNESINQDLNSFHFDWSKTK